MKPLAAITDNLTGQPMFKVLNEVQKLERSNRKILHFELGEPDFNTPPNIVGAGLDAISSGDTHYVNSQGVFEFLVAVQNATEHSRNFRPDLSQILVTPGANAIIYYTIKCVADPGDEILVPDPGFPSYNAAAAACGVVPVPVPLRQKNNFIMQPEDVEAAVTDRTKLLIINSPSNPTGAVIPAGILKELWRVAQKHDLYVLSDEIYARLVYNNNVFFSPAELDFCQERTIVCNGFSKAFAMTGWRLGVAIGPSLLIRKMTLLNETIVSCIPPFVQRAGIEAICGEQKYQRTMADEYKKRCMLLAEGLNSLPGVSCMVPSGAIYVFPNVHGTGMTDQEFASFALNEASVAMLPGSCFGRQGTGFVRLSCVTNQDNINAAVHQLKLALERRI